MAKGNRTSSQTHGAFRRLRREPARLDALDLYGRVVDQASASIADQVRIEGALASIRRNLIEVTQQESTLHGWRVQALFEAVVASLGRVRLLKLEDSGDVFFSGEALKPPDFRIVDANGDQFLVDVKNAHQKTPLHSYRLRRKDCDELRRYCDVVGVELTEVRALLEQVEPLELGLL